MKTATTFAILLATISTARAESLEEKKFWKKQQNYIDEQLKTAEKACGVKFKFEWQDQATLRSETEKTKHSPNGVCGAIVDSVASVCREGDDEKATVKAKISTIQCGFAKERSLDLKGTVLKYLGNNTQSNFSDWAKPWLLKHL
jgi:hypothetical protein